MTGVIKARGTYDNGVLKVQEKLPLEDGEEVDLLVIRRKGGISLETVYIETSKDDEKIVSQGVCLMESFPKKLVSMELKDAVEALISPDTSIPPLDKDLDRLGLYKMILDKIYKK